jgi:acyl-CoA synthetase (AMP-forming)/AMP-acid ligase II
MNFGSVCRYWARERPDGTAIRFAGTEVTWAELDQRTDELSAGLAELGLKQDERLGILSSGCLGSCQAVVATWKLGGVVVSLDRHLNSTQLTDAIIATRPRAILTDTGSAPRLRMVRRRYPDIIEVRVGEPRKGTVALSSLFRRGQSSPRVDIDSGTLAIIAYSSRRTRRAEPVLLNHGDVLTVAADLYFGSAPARESIAF